MCSFIGLSDLSSEADFTEEMTAFETTLTLIGSLSDNSITQATTLADDMANVKHMMVMVEDSRSV